jgi:hypothetical protein
VLQYFEGKFTVERRQNIFLPYSLRIGGDLQSLTSLSRGMKNLRRSHANFTGPVAGVSMRREL